MKETLTNKLKIGAVVLASAGLLGGCAEFIRDSPLGTVVNGLSQAAGISKEGGVKVAPFTRRRFLEDGSVMFKVETFRLPNEVKSLCDYGLDDKLELCDLSEYCKGFFKWNAEDYLSPKFEDNAVGDYTILFIRQ